MNRLFRFLITLILAANTVAVGQESNSADVPKPAPSFPQRVRVSSGVAVGLLKKKVQPHFPKEARQAGIQGRVVLQAETGDRGGCWGCLWETLDRRVVCPAGKAALGWPRVSARRHHELSKRSGTGPWHGHRVWIEIRIPTPHFGHSLGLLAMSTAL